MPCLHILNIASFDCPFTIAINFAIVMGALFGASVLLKGH